MLDLIANFSIGGVEILPLLQALLAFIGGASLLGLAISKFTVTTKDDEFFGKLQALILKLSLNVKTK